MKNFTTRSQSIKNRHFDEKMFAVDWRGEYLSSTSYMLQWRTTGHHGLHYLTSQEKRFVNSCFQRVDKSHIFFDFVKIWLKMEVELPLDLVNSCNFARKRQAATESYTEIQSKVTITRVDHNFVSKNGSLDAVSCVAASVQRYCGFWFIHYFWGTGRSVRDRAIVKGPNTVHFNNNFCTSNLFQLTFRNDLV